MSAVFVRMHSSPVVGAVRPASLERSPLVAHEPVVLRAASSELGWAA